MPRKKKPPKVLWTCRYADELCVWSRRGSRKGISCPYLYPNGIERPKGCSRQDCSGPVKYNLDERSV